MIIPARLNKGRLLQIAGKLEGSYREYITGSGQKIEVDRRVEIYQQEGKIKPSLKRSSKKIRLAEALNNSNTSSRVVGSYNIIPSAAASPYASDTDSFSPLNAYSETSKGLGAGAGCCPEPKRKRKGLGPLVCTSSSFSNTKLKMMTMTNEAVRELLQRTDPVHPIPKEAAVFDRPLQPVSLRTQQYRPNALKRSFDDMMMVNLKTNFDQSTAATEASVAAAAAATDSAMCSSLQAFMDLPYPYCSANSRASTATASAAPSSDCCGYVPTSVSFPPPPLPTTRESTLDMMLGCGLLSDTWDLSDLQEGDLSFTGIGSPQTVFPPAAPPCAAVEDSVFAELMKPLPLVHSCSLGSEFNALLSEDFAGFF